MLVISEYRPRDDALPRAAAAVVVMGVVVVLVVAEAPVVNLLPISLANLCK